MSCEEEGVRIGSTAYSYVYNFIIVNAIMVKFWEFNLSR
jgi:hypothetical protein